MSHDMIRYDICESLPSTTSLPLKAHSSFNIFPSCFQQNLYQQWHGSGMIWSSVMQVSHCRVLAQRTLEVNSECPIWAVEMYIRSLPVRRQIIQKRNPLRPHSTLIWIVSRADRLVKLECVLWTAKKNIHVQNIMFYLNCKIIQNIGKGYTCIRIYTFHCIYMRYAMEQNKTDHEF